MDQSLKVAAAVHTYASLFAVLAIPRVSKLGIRQVSTKSFVECEQRDLSALEPLPGAIRASSRAVKIQIRLQSADLCLRDTVTFRMRIRSHGTIDVVVRYAMFSFVFCDGDEGATTYHTANLSGPGEVRKLRS